MAYAKHSGYRETFLFTDQAISNSNNGHRKNVCARADTRDPCFSTGGWLIVAYVWGESFEWLRTVDVRKLISFNNAYCIRGYARGEGDPTGYQGGGWDMLYSLDRSGHSPPRSGTMHLENLLGI
ncbi:hypothetical protein HYQ46_003645 [Verticillium longisporum]|nr:hypothetical protein HYQ44_012964 [Verticillium longisporum]KAG7147495.1 hypothetical protein HYQ46_003645 [Verticillium longisporum]